VSLHEEFPAGPGHPELCEHWDRRASSARQTSPDCGQRQRHGPVGCVPAGNALNVSTGPWVMGVQGEINM